MRALCLFCFDYFIESWFHCSKATRRLCMTQSVFLVSIFMWVILENPALHKYVKENERRIFIAFLNST